jgi:hypothetical protein
MRCLRQRSCFAVMAMRVHFFGPFGPSGQPDPTIIQTAPKPDFLLSMDLRCAGVPASGDGDAGTADRSGAGDCGNSDCYLF